MVDKVIINVEKRYEFKSSTTLTKPYSSRELRNVYLPRPAESIVNFLRSIKLNLH